MKRSIAGKYANQMSKRGTAYSSTTEQERKRQQKGEIREENQRTFVKSTTQDTSLHVTRLNANVTVCANLDGVFSSVFKTLRAKW
jgi:hypothetical protein